MIYDWKTILEQEEKKTFDFFNLISNILPVCDSNISEYIGDSRTYEEMIFDTCRIRILPYNIEELIKDAKQMPRD